MARRENPEINAGSMADIAFLLLIFFLVTTTMDVDSGIPIKLAQKLPKGTVPPKVKEKNVFEININKNNELLVEGELMQLKDLKGAALAFIDNGGGVSGKTEKPCDYCGGAKDPKSSDHPDKAIIAITSDRETEYGVYVSVRDQLLSAYADLRNNLAKKRYGRSYTEMEEEFKDGGNKDKDLEQKVKDIKESYPQIITDIDIQGAQ